MLAVADLVALTDDEYDFAFMCLIAGPTGRARFLELWTEANRTNRNQSELPEPLIIGADFEPSPPHYTPADRMWPDRRLIVVPTPRIIEPPGEWWGWIMWRGLRGDSGLMVGLLSLLAGLVLWGVLADGGERVLIRAGGLLSMCVIWVPVVLCLLAMCGFARSAVVEFGLMAMDWQAGV